ncbi:hypothetical protein CBR_g2662 [Chara braunii]|uniref:Integrase catalytic domain-containing protein n=1 Tax=Chara braunii TaxID=69332 RepID=A0A388KDK2_CHABU|nr:hypothetical protein CBR_g2662 [Chara braunii]|eukprot:GBG68111.1 hypothetical protein CBR_g2662 [Chara braunii]
MERGNALCRSLGTALATVDLHLRSLKGEIFRPHGERVNWNSPGGIRRAIIMLNGLEIAVVEAEPVVDIIWDQLRGRGPQVNFILENDGRDRVNATTRLGTDGRRIIRDTVMEEVAGSSVPQTEPEAEEPEKVYGKPRGEEPTNKVAAAKKKFRYQIPILTMPEIDHTLSKLLGTMVSVSFQTMLKASPRLLKELRQLLTRRRVEIDENHESPEEEREEEAPQKISQCKSGPGDIGQIRRRSAKGILCEWKVSQYSTTSRRSDKGNPDRSFFRRKIPEGSVRKYKPVGKKAKPVLILLGTSKEEAMGKEEEVLRVIRKRRPTEGHRIPDEVADTMKIGVEGFLAEAETRLMKRTCQEFQLTFAFSDHQNGRLDVKRIPPVGINTVEHECWNDKGPSYEFGIAGEVTDLLRAKMNSFVAEPTASPYANRCFVFRKPNKTLRWIQDLQRLNAVTIRDVGSLPQADLLAESHAGRSIYSLIDLYSGLHVPIKLIEPYHPEANAPVERGHRTLKNTIAKLAADHLGSWPRYLKKTIFSENMTPKRTTRCIPAELWYEREIDFPVEALIPTWNRLDDDPRMTTEELIEARCQQVLKNEEVMEDVANRVLDSRMRDKARWDQVKNVMKEPLQVGETVLLRNSALESTWSGQLGRRFKGPYRVAKRVGLNTFELEDLDGTGLKGPRGNDWSGF